MPSRTISTSETTSSTAMPRRRCVARWTRATAGSSTTAKNAAITIQVRMRRTCQRTSSPTAVTTTAPITPKINRQGIGPRIARARVPSSSTAPPYPLSGMPSDPDARIAPSVGALAEPGGHRQLGVGQLLDGVGAHDAVPLVLVGGLGTAVAEVDLEDLGALVAGPHRAEGGAAG